MNTKSYLSKIALALSLIWSPSMYGTSKIVEQSLRSTNPDHIYDIAHNKLAYLHQILFVSWIVGGVLAFVCFYLASKAYQKGNDKLAQFAQAIMILQITIYIIALTYEYYR